MQLVAWLVQETAEMQHLKHLVSGGPLAFLCLRNKAILVGPKRQLQLSRLGLGIGFLHIPGEKR